MVKSSNYQDSSIHRQRQQRRMDHPQQAYSWYHRSHAKLKLQCSRHPLPQSQDRGLYRCNRQQRTFCRKFGIVCLRCKFLRVDRSDQPSRIFLCACKCTHFLGTKRGRGSSVVRL